MATMIINASKSLTTTDKFPNKNINKGIISVGNDGSHNYISYLFFDISSIPCDVSISYAELVLFKVDKFYNDLGKKFEIYPLNEYFSIFTTFKNYPSISDIIKKDFYPLASKPVVTIPVTSLVKLWLDDYHINTSIMLCGKSKNSLVHFGSAICTQKYLIPFLKITYAPLDTQRVIIKKNHTSQKTTSKARDIKISNNKISSTYLSNSENLYANSPTRSPVNDQNSLEKANIKDKTEPMNLNTEFTKNEILTNSGSDFFTNNVISTDSTKISTDFKNTLFSSNYSNLQLPTKDNENTYDEFLVKFLNSIINKINGTLLKYYNTQFHSDEIYRDLDKYLPAVITSFLNLRGNEYIVESQFANVIARNTSSLISQFISILDKIFCLLLCLLFEYCNNRPTLRQIRVIGTVAPYSKYISVVNVSIVRSLSKHTDNYYVADEYDNSQGKNPLHIDKIYNIAIIPGKGICDIEEDSLYGSYKE